MSYLQFCVDSVTAEKQIKWLSKQQTTDDTSSDRGTSLQVWKRSIKGAKAAYRNKTEGHFSYGNPEVWQGIQHLTNYKSMHRFTHHQHQRLTGGGTKSLLHLLWSQYGWNWVCAVTIHWQLTPSISTAEVRKVLCSVNPRKAAGSQTFPFQDPQTSIVYFKTHQNMWD